MYELTKGWRKTFLKVMKVGEGVMFIRESDGIKKYNFHIGVDGYPYILDRKAQFDLNKLKGDKVNGQN